MSATQELIAAALTAADELDFIYKHAPVEHSTDDLREAIARAMAQPDVSEVERRLEVYEEACRSACDIGQWEPERTALIDYVRNIIAKRDALIADNERLMQIVSQEVSAALQPVGEAAASVFRMSCPEAQAVLSDPYGLRLLMDYEDQRYSQAESMCGAEEIGQWPTARWTELRKKGRQIMSEDLEIWDSDIKAAFGFDKTPQPVGAAEVPMPDVAGELFDGTKVCYESNVRTYGDAREAAGYARGLAAVGWRDVADEPPKEAQEVLFVRGGKTIHGAWIGGIFWHNNQKMAAAKWMPLPAPQTEAALRGEVKP